MENFTALDVISDDRRRAYAARCDDSPDAHAEICRDISLSAYDAISELVDRAGMLLDNGWTMTGAKRLREALDRVHSDFSRHD